METTPHLTTPELADRWRCSASWLMTLRSSGTGPQYVKIGSKVLYPLDAVRAYEADRLVSPV